MKRKLTFILLIVSAILITPYYGCKPTLTQEQKKEEEKKKEEEEKKDDHSEAVRPDPSANKKWTKTTIDDGVIYWEFNGFDEVSGAYQDIHVTDVDMSKGWKLNMYYGKDGQKVASQVHSMYNATATINAGYETSSIFIKCNGETLHKIENNKISGTDILNWKNDGGIRFSANGKTIEFVNSLCGDKEGESKYGAALDKQRDLYRNDTNMKSWSNIMSSGPLLIYDYKPFGETFVNVSATVYNSLPSEDPQKHQGVRHPRTAVATTGQGNLLLIAVDGRTSGKREGFSAKELTKFLVKYFDPKYALNLDGGGSTTMCVEGCGNEKEVVNHPTDAGGERTVRTFFFITK